ncbi:MAG TPA: OB-fold nucleic acid binding domain-containing protein, partial [Planctomycetaceae bacterium]|nr:OB-fold nucleic acid binding domain-containing protein [Planctomycetaceae bacterium]
MSVPRIHRVLKSGEIGTTLTVKGWVRTRRDSKSDFSFVELNDGSCMANLQIVIDGNVPGYAEQIKHVTTGASLAVTGELKESPGKGQRVELHATEFQVLGLADPESFPLQKKRHS